MATKRVTVTYAESFDVECYPDSIADTLDLNADDVAIKAAVREHIALVEEEHPRPAFSVRGEDALFDAVKAQLAQWRAEEQSA